MAQVRIILDDPALDDVLQDHDSGDEDQGEAAQRLMLRRAAACAWYEKTGLTRPGSYHWHRMSRK